MKFCEKCGTQLQDDVSFCIHCGAKIEKAAEPGAAGGTSGLSAVLDLGKKLNIKLIGIIAGCVAAVILLCVIIASVSSNASGGHSSYRDAYDEYFDMMLDPDYKTKDLEDMAPEAFFEYLDDEYDVGMSELKKRYSKYKYEIMLEEFGGDNFEYSHDLKDVTKLKGDDAGYIRENLEDYYDIPEDSISTVYSMDIKLYLDGDDGEWTEHLDGVAFEIDGKWYTINALEYLEELAEYSGYRY